MEGCSGENSSISINGSRRLTPSHHPSLSTFSDLSNKNDHNDSTFHDGINEDGDKAAVDAPVLEDPIGSTKEFYNEYVDEYIKNINKAGVTHIPDEHLDRFVQYVQAQGGIVDAPNCQQKRQHYPFKSILELGCGYGRDARRLAKIENFNVLATDYSRSMLLKALEIHQLQQEKVQEEQHLSDGSFAHESALAGGGRIHYLELDMRYISKHFLPSSIHGIWACATIIHLPKTDIVDLFHSLHTILCDGGILYVSVKQGIEGETFNPDKRYGGIKKFYTYFHNQQELIEMLETAGFDIVECNTEDHRSHDTYATHPFIHVFAQKTTKLVLETMVD